MSSTILSSIGEPILHRNGLAIITDNWIVVRGAQSQAQIVVAITSVAAVKIHKTKHPHYFAGALACALVAAASSSSKEADGAPVPFALVGAILLGCALLIRRASLALYVDDDVIQTPYGTLREVAKLVALIQTARKGKNRLHQPIYELLARLRAYIHLLV